MSLKASSLKSNESQLRAINKEVKNILAHIDDELKVCHDSGRHNLAITVPMIFGIPYMNNADAQRIIYYKMLTSLLDREFIPKIELGDDNAIFHIAWKTDEELKDIDLQNALLAKHTVTRKK
jgi:hypothetical protein